MESRRVPKEKVVGFQSLTLAVQKDDLRHLTEQLWAAHPPGTNGKNYLLNTEGVGEQVMVSFESAAIQADFLALAAKLEIKTHEMPRTAQEALANFTTLLPEAVAYGKKYNENIIAINQPDGGIRHEGVKRSIFFAQLEELERNAYKAFDPEKLAVFRKLLTTIQSQSISTGFDIDVMEASLNELAKLVA